MRPRQLNRYALNTPMEIVEAYKDWQPPIDGRKAVAAAISAVPNGGVFRIITGPAMVE